MKENTAVVTERTVQGDVIVVGGGLSGLCAAVAAARHGSSVVLVQDRPMLGGNASSEIRMGICGAHGKGRKETGILEELQLNNVFYNPLMRYTLWDDQMLNLALEEETLTLLLNTSVESVETQDGCIRTVTAWNINEYCRYTISGRYFIDCSGDGILRLSGADFRIGGAAGRGTFLGRTPLRPRLLHGVPLIRCSTAVRLAFFRSRQERLENGRG